MSHFYLELQEAEKVIKRKPTTLASEQRHRNEMALDRKKGQSIVFKVYGQEVNVIQ